jgi:hypothetical protein
MNYQLEFGMDMILTAKPEIKQIAKNIEIINRRFFTAQFLSIDKRSYLTLLEVGQKFDKLAVSLVFRAPQVGIGYKNSFHALCSLPVKIMLFYSS